jgi:hypothetical protein
MLLQSVSSVERYNTLVFYVEAMIFSEAKRGCEVAARKAAAVEEKISPRIWQMCGIDVWPRRPWLIGHRSN